jgi:uncharacterized protein (DUF849 family)
MTRTFFGGDMERLILTGWIVGVLPKDQSTKSGVNLKRQGDNMNHEENMDKIQHNAEALDHVKHEIGEKKQELRGLHWEQKRAEYRLVEALVKADMHEYLKVDFKNLKVFLNENYM